MAISPMSGRPGHIRYRSALSCLLVTCVAVTAALIGASSGPAVAAPVSTPLATTVVWNMSHPAIATVRNQDGRMEVFYVDKSGFIFHRWQSSPGGGWDPYTVFDGRFVSIAVEINADGRVELFASNDFNGDGGYVYHRWQTEPGGGADHRSWSPWVQLDAEASTIAVARNQDGRLELFGTSASGFLFHWWQNTPGGGANHSDWSSYAVIGGAFQDIAAETNADGLIELFGIKTDRRLFHRRQAVAGGGFDRRAWSDWSQMQLYGQSLAAARNADGRLELFISDQGKVKHTWQSFPTSWNWEREEAYGGQGAIWLAAETTVDGRIELFGLDSLGGLVYHRWQANPDGGLSRKDWTTWVGLDGTGTRPVYDVTFSPLSFTLLRGCDDLSAHDEPKVYWVDDRGQGSVELVMTTNESRQISQFARGPFRVTEADPIQIPALVVDEQGPHFRPGIFALPARGIGNLIPSVSFDRTEIYNERHGCQGRFFYRVTINVVEYV